MNDYLKQEREVINSKLLKIPLKDFQEELKIAKAYLSQQDKVLKGIISKVGDCRIKPHKRYFETLVDAIISQQLSMNVAEVIFKRFKQLFEGSSFPKPEEILRVKDSKIRRCGLSKIGRAHV